MERLKKDPQYVELKPDAHQVIELKYATEDNFTGTDLYGPFKECYLQKVAADKYKNAVKNLQKTHPGWKFIIYDALRPRSVQWRLWEKVKGTSQQKYVADPEKGSNHNYGLALDIGLVDDKGQIVDMGAPFDGFTPISEPKREAEMLKAGKLTREQLGHRLILRKAMTEAGFTQLAHEWWHYDALPMSQIRGKFQIVG